MRGPGRKQWGDAEGGKEQTRKHHLVALCDGRCLQVSAWESRNVRADNGELE